MFKFYYRRTFFFINDSLIILLKGYADQCPKNTEVTGPPPKQCRFIFESFLM